MAGAPAGARTGAPPSPDPGPVRPGLYVHVPFCRSKCPYCDFFSLPRPELIDQWLEDLKKEAALYTHLAGPFGSLYLGGGTPSFLNPSQLRSLFKTLESFFRLAPGAEVTLEANPEDVSPEKMEAALALGVNRVSLGAQSLTGEELALLGRRHSAGRVLEAVGIIRESGCANLGLDLIYGLPGQDGSGWSDNLHRALALSPEHLSCYQLSLAPGAALPGRRGLLPLPGEEESRELFLLTSSLLEGAGFLHYEISNFARDRDLISRHNSKYWSHVPYLGLGPSAHSFWSGKRWWNHRSLKAYGRDLGVGRRPLAGEELLDSDQARLEALYLGLRTSQGMELALISGPGQASLDRLVEEGLIRIESGRLTPTREGMIVADALALELAPGSAERI
jgi:oxygen-independent coproporphyrinogen-3 oxidase